MIILLEPHLENWGVRGGIPASEIDFGFKIDKYINQKKK
jgi:hypothetical protein